MVIVLIRTVILYLVVLMVIRLMGKSELSKMSPFQFVIIFMIAELAAIPIESPSASLINGVIAIFTLLLLQVLIAFISLKSEKFKNFINGSPSVLIDKGNINHKALKKLRISINDLTEQLRLGNAPALPDVDYAIMESNGDLTVILKPDKRPVTPTDMGITKSNETIPSVVVSDGIMYKNNLDKLGITEEDIMQELATYNIPDLDSVFMVFCDGSKKLHIYVEDENTGTSREVATCDPL